ncbi:MAG: tyrosine-protein phosphatase [Planctomycetes bacterium]|nr:tyrosine-protein phosphatase [Planctomycetota bacterium]
MNIPRFLRRLFRRPYDGLRHFGVVESNKLYRCGQPSPDDLRQLIARYRLKTVIALRGRRDAADPDEWEKAERSVCRELGAEFVSLPCNHKNPPSRDQVERFLALTRDGDRQPALVHCRIGRQRTGLFCALFRVHVQGVDPEEALREMDDLGFGIHHRRHQRLLDVFREFSRELPFRARRAP